MQIKCRALKDAAAEIKATDPSLALRKIYVFDYGPL